MESVDRIFIAERGDHVRVFFCVSLVLLDDTGMDGHIQMREFLAACSQQRGTWNRNCNLCAWALENSVLNEECTDPEKGREKQKNETINTNSPWRLAHAACMHAWISRAFHFRRWCCVDRWNISELSFESWSWLDGDKKKDLPCDDAVPHLIVSAVLKKVPCYSSKEHSDSDGSSKKHKLRLQHVF